jgi:hypothetical protein
MQKTGLKTPSALIKFIVENKLQSDFKTLSQLANDCPIFSLL